MKSTAEITVTLYLSPSLAPISGQRKLNLNIPKNYTLANLLSLLKKNYPELNHKLTKSDNIPYNYFVNRHLIQKENWATCNLQTNDNIHILIPVTGG